MGRAVSLQFLQPWQKSPAHYWCIWFATCEVTNTVFSYTFYLFKYVILVICVMNNINWILLSLQILLIKKKHSNDYLPVQNHSGIITLDWKIEIKKFRWRNLFKVLCYTFFLFELVILSIYMYVINNIHQVLLSLQILLIDNTHRNVYLRSTTTFWYN